MCTCVCELTRVPEDRHRLISADDASRACQPRRAVRMAVSGPRTEQGSLTRRSRVRHTAWHLGTRWSPGLARLMWAVLPRHRVTLS